MDKNLTKNGFSVLISVYHKERPEFLTQSLNSIWYNQTLKPNEIILVKDGPLTQQLDEIILEFVKHTPTRLIVNDKNLGLSAALNKGLKCCNYDIVARMDTDDISVRNRFERQFNFLKKNPSVDIIGSYAEKINEIGEVTDDIMKVPLKNYDIYKYIWTCPFIHPSVMFRKDKILYVGSYNKNAGPRQDDYDLWFRCAIAGYNFANINESLIQYRFLTDTIRKNNIKVGWYRLKVGFNGCRKIKCSLIAYIGILIPFIRTLLPYPLNIYFYKTLNFLNPRTR